MTTAANMRAIADQAYLETRAPQWSPVDDSTADLLTVLADPHPIVGADVPDLFLAACRRDAMANGGLVSVNRVRELLAGEDIPPRRYSALWSHFTGRGKPMRKVTAEEAAKGMPRWEICKGSSSGNDGRSFPLRRWIG